MTNVAGLTAHISAQQGLKTLALGFEIAPFKIWQQAFEGLLATVRIRAASAAERNRFRAGAVPQHIEKNFRQFGERRG